MGPLLERLRSSIAAWGPQKSYWIGYSGGLDSHVLLHLCVQLRQSMPSLKLHAIHVNHQLSPHANAWAAHCATVCDRLKVNFIHQKITVPEGPGISPEEAAREQRYQVFRTLLTQDDCLLTAHHQDDQAETVLLQLLRGAGPKGLAAMPALKPLGAAHHGRPLLTSAHDDLKKYAAQHQLAWIEDGSNAERHFPRNFLRHEIVPLLKKRWPEVNKAIARAAGHCAEAQTLLESKLAIDLHALALPQATGPALCLKKLSLCSAEWQRQLLRYWFKVSGFVVPSAVKLAQLQRDFLSAGRDKSPHIIWKNAELRRYRDAMYLMPTSVPHDKSFSAEWGLTAPLPLSQVGHLHAVAAQGWGLKAGLGPVTVRFRQGGERCRLPGRNFHHDLKKLLQKWGVPPWQRDRVPLVFIQDRLAAVVGYFLDEAFAAKGDEPGHFLFVSAARTGA